MTIKQEIKLKPKSKEEAKALELYGLTKPYKNKSKFKKKMKRLLSKKRRAKKLLIER